MTEKKQASPFKKTYEGDPQSVDRNMRLLIQKMEELERRVKALEAK